MRSPFPSGHDEFCTCERCFAGILEPIEPREFLSKLAAQAARLGPETAFTLVHYANSVFFKPALDNRQLEDIIERQVMSQEIKALKPAAAPPAAVRSRGPLNLGGAE